MFGGRGDGVVVVVWARGEEERGRVGGSKEEE